MDKKWTKKMGKKKWTKMDKKKMDENGQKKWTKMDEKKSIYATVS